MCPCASRISSKFRNGETSIERYVIQHSCVVRTARLLRARTFFITQPSHYLSHVDKPKLRPNAPLGRFAFGKTPRGPPAALRAAGQAMSGKPLLTQAALAEIIMLIGIEREGH